MQKKRLFNLLLDTKKIKSALSVFHEKKYNNIKARHKNSQS